MFNMAGLLLTMEFKNGTVDEAADAYMYRADIQYALNLGRDHPSMAPRTVERYQKTFRKNQLAETVMNRVREALLLNGSLFSSSVIIREYLSDWTKNFVNATADQRPNSSGM